MNRSLAAVIAFLVLSISPTFAQEIWLGAMEPFWRNHWGLPPNDYLELFRPDAPWKDVAAHVNVFQLTEQYVLFAPDAELATIFADLNRRHIAFAQQVESLLATNDCGRGIEGYAGPNALMRTITRVRQFGGTINTVVLDEPLNFGHVIGVEGTKTGCLLPIPEMTRQVAASVAQIRSIFPDARVGDMEPFAGWPKTEAQWNHDLAQWFSAFQSATGHKLAFEIAEVIYPSPNWSRALVEGAQVARTNGILFGVIYNGTRRDATDAAWTADARSHYTAIETSLRLKPDIALFSTWTQHPDRMLPQDQDGTMTNLVLGYLRSHHVAQ